jgi:hypothetical protein
MTPLPEDTLAQGDVRLLETEVGRRLLASRHPARLGYVAPDGTPRVLATWFHWTGDVLSMPTWVGVRDFRVATSARAWQRVLTNI